MLSQTVPTVLLAPILAILLGFGLAPKLIVVAVVCFFPIVVNAVDGLRSADAELVRMMRTLDANPSRDLPPRRAARSAAGDLLRRARRRDLRRGRRGLRRMVRLVGGARVRRAPVGAVARHRAHLRRRPHSLGARARPLRARLARRASAHPLAPGGRTWFVGSSLVALACVAVLGPAAAAGAQHVSLTLDWTPNPDHVGLYYARDEGLFAKAGLDVAIHAPSDPSAPLKLVGVGKSDLAVSYEQELFFAAAKKLPVVAVAAVVPQPLNSIMAIDPKLKRLADLRGKTIGITGVPSDYASLDTALSTGRSDAATSRSSRSVTACCRRCSHIASTPCSASTATSKGSSCNCGA